MQQQAGLPTAAGPATSQEATADQEVDRYSYCLFSRYTTHASCPIHAAFMHNMTHAAISTMLLGCQVVAGPRSGPGGGALAGWLTMIRIAASDVVTVCLPPLLQQKTAD